MTLFNILRKTGRIRFRLILILSLLLFSSLIIIHILSTSKGPDYSGPLLVLNHFHNIILVSALLFIFACLGNYILSRFGFRFKNPLEAFLFFTAIGGCLLSTAILVCGVLHGFHKLTLFLLLLFSVFIVRRYLSNTILIIVKCIYCLRENSTIVPLLGFGFVAVFMICRALAPSTDWDTLTYHLRVPAQFLQKGAIYLPEDNLATAFVQLVHMWYVPLLAFGSEAGPALLNALFALLLCVAVFAFALLFFNNPTANLSLVAFWASSVILLVAITPRVDVTLAFFLFLGHYALLKALGNPFKLHFFYLSAVLLGFAVGIKYSAIFYILAISPLIIWLVISTSRGSVGSIKHLLYFGSVVVIAASPWLIKNFYQFNSPLYPFFIDRQPEPWLNHFYSDLLGGSSLIKLAIAESIQHMANPFNLLEFIKAPGRLMVEFPEGHFYTFNFIFFVLPLWLLFLRNKIINWLMVPAILYMLMVIVFWPFSNLRYLIPAMIPLTIVASYIIAEICNRLFKTLVLRKFCLGLLIVIVMILPAMAMYFWPSNKLALKYLSGLMSQEDYLRSYEMVRSYSEIVYFVNHNLSGGDKVLMIFEGRGYYFRVPVIQDNELSNWALISQRGPDSSRLRAAGISHVLVSTYAPVYLHTRGFDLKTLRFDGFQLFAEIFLVPIYKNDAYVLYSLKN